jgi:hypothetical protein
MSIEALAKLFIDRNNPFHVAVAQGNVISANPLQVQYGESIILDKSHLVVNRLHAEGFTVGSLTISDPLQIGDEVILIPDSEHKTWYLVAKVGVIT